MAPPTDVSKPEAGPANTARRDLLLEIQAAAQLKWQTAKLFEVDAPSEGEPDPGKFFGNFPYPYMNGLLHLGHAFSMSKLEFAAAYHRLCGKRVLFPQAFHCTGMPIKACADKLDYELRTYGCPPVFPTEEEAAAAAAAAAEQAAAVNGTPEMKDPTKFSGKKSKAVAKKGTGATQWAILRQSGIPEEEIPRFRTTDHWLHFFPPLAAQHLTEMGCGIDWRRSFITTDLNPYYDSFVRWQFWTLYKLGVIIKDKRNTIYSALDGQPCADHDRASGEGVNPQDYTLIKLEVLELPEAMAGLAAHGKVFLLAATLRPETMFGQTNCWALPEGRYGAYKGLNDEVYILTERAALNMSYQEKLPVRGEPECLMELMGQDLIGLPVKAPNAIHQRVYVLPLLTILTTKGTGIVTSVPSDAPDDYIALQDLKKKPKLREKYGVRDEWVLPFEVVPIINIPGFGDQAAQVVCEELKIASQNDSAKLAEAKQKVYLKGFTEGVMLVGPYAGQKVSAVKSVLKEEMIAAGQAIPYSEPEKQVISRSGDECVVALTDQWYLTYGEDAWLATTTKALDQLETFSQEARHCFEHTLGWLRAWACSRSFGLGTRMPWDNQFLIESLSDSTIYMALYTVAHVLHEHDMYGHPTGPIKPEHMTNEVWDAIFLGRPVPADCAVPPPLMDTMRREFKYWYPWDLRVSGKDLINNHLTFSLYNHTAIWADQPNMWPRAIRCNGHLLLNSEKMSKSTGNFKTLSEAIKDYGADAMRWALADAGDGMDDANFESSTANAAILRMTREMAWMEETLAPSCSGLREGEPTLLYDRIFANAINIAIAKTKESFERMTFREALKAAAYDLGNARDVYRFACGPDGMNKQLVLRYIEVSTQLMAPITPHTCEHVWSNMLQKPGSVLTCGWPAGDAPDFVMQRAAQYIEDFTPSLRKLIQKAEAPPRKGKGPVVPQEVVHADVFVAEQFVGWQQKALLALQAAYQPSTQGFAEDVNAQVLAAVQTEDSMTGKSEKEVKAVVMPFTKFKIDEAKTVGPQVLDVKLPFDERALLTDNMPYIKRTLKLQSMAVHLVTDADAVAAAASAVDVAAAYPGTPVMSLKVQPVA